MNIKDQKNLSSDSASIVDTVLHGVKWYEKKQSKCKFDNSFTTHISHQGC